MKDLLEGLLPDDVRATSARIEPRSDTLLPEESREIERAVPQRKWEFATGRHLARTLLAECGFPEFALLRDPDRTPCWPKGIVGSITHARDLCAVAVAPERAYLGIGLDLEPDEAADMDIERVVCRAGELAWVAAEGEAERARRCRIVFSVKEAVYKAFYPRTREFWGFQDVEVAIDLDAGAFDARLPESAGRAEITGRLRRRSGWIVAAVTVPV